MKNSLSCRPRTYAPRGGAKRKRVGVTIDSTNLARCKALDNAEDKTDAAYVLEVYLEGQAVRATTRPPCGGLERK